MDSKKQESVTAYVGLGANLGEPAVQISTAIDDLDQLPEVVVTARSEFYRSSPWGVSDQPDFVNAAIAVKTTLSPRDLLKCLLEIEANAGRRRGGRQWGPRVLDLDLLAYGNVIMKEAGLTLPHPRIAERNFVLKPLLDLDEELVLPGLGEVSAQLDLVGQLGLALLEKPSSQQQLAPRIVVEGPPFAGTRDLALALAMHFDAQAVVDDPDNPFSSRFQRPSDSEQLAAQLHALFRRQHKLEGLLQADLFSGCQILGFLPDRSSLTAAALLPAKEQALFQQVEACLTTPAVRPELLIYLQVSPGVAMHRQSALAGASSQYTEGMMDAICARYMELFYQYSYSPVLTVNADHGLWSIDHPGWQELVDKIESVQAGKHYFNPMAVAI